MLCLNTEELENSEKLKNIFGFYHADFLVQKNNNVSFLYVYIFEHDSEFVEIFKKYLDIKAMIIFNENDYELININEKDIFYNECLNVYDKINKSNEKIINTIDYSEKKLEEIKSKFLNLYIPLIGINSNIKMIVLNNLIEIGEQEHFKNLYDDLDDFKFKIEYDVEYNKSINIKYFTILFNNSFIFIKDKPDKIIVSIRSRNMNKSQYIIYDLNDLINMFDKKILIQLRCNNEYIKTYIKFKDILNVYQNNLKYTNYFNDYVLNYEDLKDDKMVCLFKKRELYTYSKEVPDEINEWIFNICHNPLKKIKILNVYNLNFDLDSTCKFYHEELIKNSAFYNLFDLLYSQILFDDNNFEDVNKIKLNHFDVLHILYSDDEDIINKFIKFNKSMNILIISRHFINNDNFINYKFD